MGRSHDPYVFPGLGSVPTQMSAGALHFGDYTVLLSPPMRDLLGDWTTPGSARRWAAIDVSSSLVGSTRHRYATPWSLARVLIKNTAQESSSVDHDHCA